MNSLDHTFQALADPTRRAILARLALGSATVGELAAPFDVSMPAVSRHLKVLEDAALIENQREGKHRRCSLKPQALKDAHEHLGRYARFWTGSLDRLDAFLKQNPEKTP